MSLLSVFAKTPVPQVLETATMADQPTEEYKQLAEKLGVCLSPPKALTLESVLRDEFIPVYSLGDVSRYLGRKVPWGKVWGWKCLRTQDFKLSEGKITFGYNDISGRFLPGIYDKAVPLPVLLTIDKIESAMRGLAEQPAFFVSDYAVRMPDPFLMVTIPVHGVSQRQEVGGLWQALADGCFVVERWDEPSFR